MCDRQDLAVYIIKKSKAFVLEIGKIKRLGSKDRMRLTALIQDLSIQFNNFRGKQPFIMDSILETIDNLRLMQKNYQSEKELFNFDYKKDLRNHVVSRDRVFGTRKLAEIKNESDDEEELAIKNQLSLINEATHQKVE